MIARARHLGFVIALGALSIAADAHAASIFGEQAILNAGADGRQYDTFGEAVAVSGNTAIIGAEADDVTTLRPGAAYVFVRNGTTWTRQQRLTASDAADHDFFGAAVAISGDTAIVGALRSNTGFGAAYVFVRNGTTWTQQQKLTAPIDVNGDICGSAVGISGNTAVMTCQNNAQGAAYVFVRNGTAWSLQGTLLPSNSANGDFFGWSAAIESNTVVIGAISDKAGGAQPVGTATVFVRNGTAWSLQQKLTAPDGVPFDRFGYSVGLSGNTAVVGQATGDDQNHPLNQAAYVFVRSGTAWTNHTKLTSADVGKGDGFGLSVAIATDTVFVGAPTFDAGSSPTTDEGATFIFERTNGAWEAKDRLSASDQATGSTIAGAGSLFGFSVALSGSTAIIGAADRKVGDNFYQGQAYAFVNPDTDDDGLPDDWETNGVTIDGVFIDLPKMGADKNHKDLFVHADWMHPDPSRPGFVFKPYVRAMKIVTDAFAIAPVPNPDHKNGITLHVDLGPSSIMNPKTGASWGALSRAGEVPFKAVSGDSGSGFSWGFIDANEKAVHFTPSKRASVFRWMVFANDYAQSDDSSGLARAVPGTDFIVTLGTFNPAGGSPLMQAGTFMHELGHTLGLKHGGDEEINGKPNYVSVMNYTFQMIGLLTPATQRRFDYSAYLLDPLNETSLNETVGIAHPLHYLTIWNRLSSVNVPTGANTCLSTPNTYYRLFLPTDSLDWNCNGIKDTAPVSGDINRDGLCIGVGPDGIADTAGGPLTGDDDLRGNFVWSGPNRTCETTAIPDDVQVNPVGFVEPAMLTGFNDWAHVALDGGGAIGGSGVGPTEDLGAGYEPSASTLLDLVPPALIAEEATAPIDVVSVSQSAGPAPLTVDFDGSASTAVNGTIVDWAWDFGDGTTGSGATPQHTYDTPGEYYASVTVTDSNDHVNLVPLLQLITVDDGGAPNPTPTATPNLPANLDHFALFSTTATKGAAKFVKFGPVALADGFTSGGFDVLKPGDLGVPAGLDGGAIIDGGVDLDAYAVKPSKGTTKPSAHPNVRVASACGETVVTTTKPVTLLVPSAFDPNAVVTAPNANDHDLDHFLCYQVKVQKKDAAGAPVAALPKGAQADVGDTFGTARYDLKKLVALCNPVAKSGTPAFLSGPNKGTLLPITQAVIRNAGSHLLCYQVALATKTIAQNGCGPAASGDKGTPIVPKPPKHVPRIGAHVADQLGARQIDTKKETLLCLPAVLR